MVVEGACLLAVPDRSPRAPWGGVGWGAERGPGWLGIEKEGGDEQKELARKSVKPLLKDKKFGCIYESEVFVYKKSRYTRFFEKKKKRKKTPQLSLLGDK